MSQNQLHVLQVLWDNVLLIVGGVASWIFTIGGIYDFTRGLLTLAALALSCAVSAATLYKLAKDLKKKNGKK